MPPPSAHPRDAVAAAVRALGEQEVVAWCGTLVRGEPSRHPLGWLGGTEGWPAHWAREWGVRGLRYAWGAGADATVRSALRDEHPRVRAMAVAVAVARGVDDAVPLVEALRDDAAPRVRAAAERALRRWAS
ncbi:HEAT repeat domain-containing protein [Agrococcus versicolor]